MNRQEKKMAFAGAIVVLLMATVAVAQITTGSLNGVVTTAEGGAAVAGAQISATHLPTGTQYNVVADDIGRFRILNVRVGGPYVVTATMDQFHVQEANNVFVQLGEDPLLHLHVLVHRLDDQAARLAGPIQIRIP